MRAFYRQDKLKAPMCVCVCFPGNHDAELLLKVRLPCPPSSKSIRALCGKSRRDRLNTAARKLLSVVHKPSRELALATGMLVLVGR